MIYELIFSHNRIVAMRSEHTTHTKPVRMAALCISVQEHMRLAVGYSLESICYDYSFDVRIPIGNKDVHNFTEDLLWSVRVSCMFVFVFAGCHFIMLFICFPIKWHRSLCWRTTNSRAKNILTKFQCLFVLNVDRLDRSIVQYSPVWTGRTATRRKTFNNIRFFSASSRFQLKFINSRWK